AEVLDGAPEGGGRMRGARQAGVAQADRPSLSTAADWHELAAAFGDVEECLPAPDVGHGLRRRHHRHEVIALGPEGGHAVGLEVPVELLEFRCVGGSVHLLHRSSSLTRITQYPNYTCCRRIQEGTR